MKNVIQGTTLSGTGAVSIAPGAEITIRNPAGQLVPLWADRAGTQPHDNPFLTDNEGNFRVYADSGWVHVRAQKNGSVREWRYVPIGSASAMDIGEVYAALGSEIYSSVSEGLSNSAEGDYFLVESEGALDLYRVVNGVAEQRELGIDADAVLATRAYADGVAAEAESNATNAAVAAASSAYQQATEYSDSQLQTHRESGDHDGRYYTKTQVDQALEDKVDDSDPRLSDAREWTAEVVSQAEAEAGTASVPRKWTAQRVRQAAEAALAGGVTWDAVENKPDTATRWPSWDEVTGKPTTFPPSSHTHTKSQITDAGTAINYNVDASGLPLFAGFNPDRRHAVPPSSEYNNCDSITFNSLYNCHGSVTLNSPTNDWFFLHTMVHAAGDAWVTQVAYGMQVSEVWLRRRENGTWGAWHRIGGEREHLWSGDSAGPFDLLTLWGPGMYEIEVGHTGTPNNHRIIPVYVNQFTADPDYRVVLTYKAGGELKAGREFAVGDTTYSNEQTGSLVFCGRIFVTENSEDLRMKNIWRVASYR